MTPPNILVIIMDDQRADTLSGFDGPRPQTPFLDQLVESGTQFRNMFVTTPICTPGRAEVLTGCHSFHNGVPWFKHPINPELTLLPRHFADHGYHCMHVGKWHNDGHPRDKGYHVTRREMNSENLLSHAEHGHTMCFEEEGRRVTGHSSELFTDAFLEELDRAPGDRPWFGYLAYHSPHDPFDCPAPFDRFYDPEQVPLPENYMPQAPCDNGDMTIRDELLLPWPRTQSAIRTYRSRYWSMITHHDHQIGRVLRRLEETGQRERTLIVFTGDHGLAVGSHGLLGKENMYDHSCRIPCVMTGPGVPAGQAIDAMVSNCDIYPTLCEASGLPTPDTVRDGRSLAPFVATGEGPQRDLVVSAFQSPDPVTRELRNTQRAIRTEEWKLIFYPLIGRYELYNLAEDPLELSNLLEPWKLRAAPLWSYAPARSASSLVPVVHQLRDKLIAWQKANNDTAWEQVEACPPVVGEC